MTTEPMTRAERAEAERQERWPDRPPFPVACKLPKREQWERVDIAARRVLSELGPEAMAALTDDELRYAFLSIGNVKAWTEHCKTMRDLVLPNGACHED